MLKFFFELQKIDSKIDSIRTIRGELPLEVQDLEDEIGGLNTRIAKINDEIKEIETEITNIKGAEYFAYVEELASLITYDAEYAGPEDDLLPKQEELASKLGFTLDQIRDI